MATEALVFVLSAALSSFNRIETLLVSFPLIEVSKVHVQKQLSL